MTPYIPSLIAWYLSITIIGWLEFPILYRLFHRLPDRGITFAKPFGLLITMYIAWLLGSLGFLRNDASGLLFAIILSGVLGLIWVRRSGLTEMWTWMQGQWKFILAVELLFLTTFVGWAWVRSYNPEILGTEKPMEYMFINSILRSPTLPPHDAWLSGYSISYYYFGYMIVASLARLTGTTSSVAFNLGLAVIFALSSVGALGVSVNLIALVKNKGQQTYNGKKLSSPLLSSFGPGLLGPLFVLIVGNFYGVLEVTHSNGIFAKLDIPAIWYDFGQTVNPEQITPQSEFLRSPGIKGGRLNFWDWLDIKQLDTPLPPKPDHFVLNFDNWFFAARVLHDRNLVGVETEVIDEMPAFSFLLGDLHPHLMALPFVILTIALALDWLLWGQEVTLTHGKVPWPTLDRLLLSCVILGSLSFLNTWDFPIYWFLTTLALILGLVSTSGWRILVKYGWHFLKLSITIFFLGIVLYFPFYLTFQSQAGGILPNIIYPTRFQQVVVMFGPVLVCVTIYLFWLIIQGKSIFNRRVALIGGIGIIVVLSILVFMLIIAASLSNDTNSFAAQELNPLTLKEAEGLISQRRFVDSLTTLVPALMFGISLGLIFGIVRLIELSRANSGGFELTIVSTKVYSSDKAIKKKTVEFGSPSILMTLALILTSSLLLIGPEFVYIRDVFGSRMNTVFKFYFQIWIFWGLVSAFGVWYLLRYTRFWVQLVLGGLICIVIFLGLIYLPGGLWSKTNRFTSSPTLDGMAYFLQRSSDDWAAIQWFQENVPSVITGKPVILEGTKGAYWVEGDSSRLSMATGIPTVVGWVNHEIQWRGNYSKYLGSREEDIRTIYQSRDWDTTKKLLDAYQVEYLVVGSKEREWYQPIYEIKFDKYMRRVFQSGDLTIYQRVDK